MPLTKTEAISFLRSYRKVMRINIANKGSLSDLFSKILVNPYMYDELTFGLQVSKKHVVLFEGIPIQSCDEMPYGGIFYVPKFMTVELASVVPEKVH